MGIIYFNGIPSTDANIVVEHYPNYQYAEKDYETQNVVGRNGTLYHWNGNYKNVRQPYDIAFGAQPGDDDRFQEMASNVVEWLHGTEGYVRLSDSYSPDWYRLAVYKESGNLKNLLNSAGRATINFDCKPQRFLVVGDTPVEFESTDVITNPTNQKAKPIITVYGTGDGVLHVGSYQVTLSGINGWLTIDSEAEESYKDSEFQNEKTIMPGGFPILLPGDNGISFSGNITRVEIIPKWWKV